MCPCILVSYSQADNGRVRELFSSARHHLGIYRCVVVSARYQIPQGLDPVPAITSALASVVRDQPVLRVGILGQDTSTAAFSHIPEIDLRNHLEWRHVDAEALDAYDAEIARTQGWLHNQLFENIETQSPWKVLCLRPQKESLAEAVTGSSNGFVDIFFAYHHALADGSGGKEFHQHLLAALQNQANPTVEHTLYFPDAPRLPESQEEAVPFRNSYLFLLRTVWTMLGPAFLKPRKIPVWAGADVDFSTPYVTGVKPITIGGDALKSFLAASREQNCTLTTALHGILLSSFAKRLSEEEAQSFACSTPVSLRPWIKAPPSDPELKDKLRTCLTTHALTYPPETLKALRAPGADVDALVWQAGQRMKTELAKCTSTLPKDDVAGLMPMIKDFLDYWRQKDGKPREATWEISNVGVIPSPAKTDDGSAASRWKHLSAMFTNGAFVAGCIIGTNVISVEGGTLTIAVTWLKNSISEELIEGVASDIKEFVDKIHKSRSPPS